MNMFCEEVKCIYLLKMNRLKGTSIACKHLLVKDAEVEILDQATPSMERNVLYLVGNNQPLE